MAKIDYRKLSSSERQALQREWKVALRKLPEKDTIIAFLSYFLTPSEQIMLARRIRVARMLLAGKSFLSIRRNLHVGFDLIEQIDRSLSTLYEDYRATVPELLAHAKKRPSQGNVPIDSHTFRELRAKYPLHFLFFNLLLGDPRS